MGAHINWSEQYQDLNIEAHRTYPQRFAIPAVTWHLAFWPKAKDHWLDAERENQKRWWQHPLDRTARRQRWIDSVNRFVCEIAGGSARQFHYDDGAPSSFTDCDPKLQCDPRNALDLEQLRGCAAIRARVQIHSEHASASFFVSLNHPDLPEEVQKIWVEAQNVLAPNGDSNDISTVRKLKRVDDLYSATWSRIFDNREFQCPGQVFAHFRGAILPASLLDPNAPIMNGKFIRRKAPDFFWRQFLLRSILYKRRFDEEDNTPINPEKHRETVANLALRGRCLYASSLGTRILGSSDQNRLLSEGDLRYVMLYAAEEEYEKQNPIQMNRTLHRLHHMGRLRLLALRDYGEIRGISGDLHKLERDLDAMIAKQKGKPPKNYKLQKFLADISALNNKVVGGLSYRVWRSKYYFERFRSLVEAFDVVRLEGWLPYDEFMKRRLYQQLSHIQLVGERADGLRKRFDEYLALIQATRGVVWQISAFIIALAALLVSLIAIRTQIPQ